MAYAIDTTSQDVPNFSRVHRSWTLDVNYTVTQMLFWMPYDVALFHHACDGIQAEGVTDSMQKKVDRIVRLAEGDIKIMDVIEFRKIANIQVLLQLVRKKTRKITLGEVSDMLVQSVARQLGIQLGVQYSPVKDVLWELIQGYIFGDTFDDAMQYDIAEAIPLIQRQWRNNPIDVVTVGTVFITILGAAVLAFMVRHGISHWRH